MSRAAKSVTISLPPEMVEELDRVRKRAQRSRSDVLREAVHRYLMSEPMERIPVEDPEPGELEALDHGRQQTARGEYVLLENLLNQANQISSHRRGLPLAGNRGPVPMDDLGPGLRREDNKGRDFGQFSD